MPQELRGEDERHAASEHSTVTVTVYKMSIITVSNASCRDQLIIVYTQYIVISTTINRVCVVYGALTVHCSEAGGKAGLVPRCSVFTSHPV